MTKPYSQFWLEIYSFLVFRLLRFVLGSALVTDSEYQCWGYAYSA